MFFHQSWYGRVRKGVRRSPDESGKLRFYICLSIKAGTDETAVVWVRRRGTVSQPLRPWKETPAEYAARLRSICQHINANFDVEGLCRKFLERVQLVVDAEGGRIKPYIHPMCQ